MTSKTCLYSVKHILPYAGTTLTGKKIYRSYSNFLFKKKYTRNDSGTNSKKQTLWIL